MQNIVGIFTNYIPKTFPYTDNYGPFTFWSRFDLIHDGNGGVQFKVGGYHLNVNGDNLGTSNSGSYAWTLEESASGAYYIKDDTGRYLTGAGTGYKTVSLADTASSDALWYFMDPIEAVTDLGLPHAETAEHHSHALENDVVVLDGSDSEDSDSNTALVSYAWSVFSAPDGSIADVTDATAAVTSITPDVIGAYVLALTVIDADGLSNTTHQNLTVHEGVFYETSATQVDENSKNYTWTPFQATPLIFANMQGFGGSDPAGVRIWNTSSSGFTAMIEEETSLDPEIGHNNETLGILALPGGDLVDENGTIIGEAGSFNHTQSGTGFSTHTFTNTYNNPVVIMMMNTYNGTNPAHMRLDGTDGNSVDYKVEEWAYLDANHNQETIAYLVVEAGVHTLLDGSLLQAQKVTTNQDWVDFDFATAYSANPVVLSMSQTQNGADPIVTRHNNLTSASMSLRVQEEEAEDGTHNNEVIGVISIGN